MYPHINQIFYKNNKFDDPESIKTLVDYALCDDLLVDFMSLPLLKTPLVTSPLVTSPLVTSFSPIKIPESNDEWFLPKQMDTIFWCMYVFIYGKGEYNHIGHSYGNKMLEEKQKIMEFIKMKPKILKSSNVKLTNGAIQEIQAEFMVDKMTSFYGVAALAIYYKTPIFLVNKEKKTYLKFLPEMEYYEKQPCYLLERGNNRYKLNMSEKPELDLESMICLESHLKPFKPASYYKIEDLNTISEKIGFIQEKRLKKTELYEKLCELCVWV